MNLEFLATDFIPEPHVQNMTEEIFVKAAHDIGLPVEELTVILIADDHHYAEAVERIAPGGGFTRQDETGGQGMAKANTTRQSNGNLSHKVVVHLKVLDGALGAIFGNSNREAERAAVEELCFYVLYHELGHCKDNRIRPDRPSPTICLPGRGFEIHQVTRYYVDILEEEYAACAFAAPWMSCAAYQNTVQALTESLTFFRSEAARLTLAFRSDPITLSKLAATVAGLAWFQLIQFAKTAASRLQNSALKNIQLDTWTEPQDEMVVELLTEFEAGLSAHWATYPNWSSEPAPFLREAWEAFALLEGFKFVEDQRGGAVYW